MTDDVLNDLARLYLFSLALNSPTVFSGGNADAGNRFHSFDVRIKKEEAKHFIRLGGTYIDDNKSRTF